jgi:hypothetical protein
MTRFVTYDPEVATRLSQAVGVHRVELRAGTDSPRKVSPALLDAIASRKRSAVLMPASDEQVLVVHVNDNSREDPIQDLRKRKRTAKQQQEDNVTEIGSRPSGFLGLHDESVFSDEQEDPPRSLWKQDE